MILQKRGRPKRTHLDNVRTKYWFYTVHRVSQKTPHALEKEFSKEQFTILNGETSGPKQWYKYKGGSTSPSRNLIDRVESKYPRTRQAFDHYLWELLKPHPPSNTKLKEILGAANPKLVKYIGTSKRDFPSIVFPLTSDRSIKALSNVLLEDLLFHRDTPLYKFLGLLCIVLDAEKKSHKDQYFNAIPYIHHLLPYILNTYFSTVEDDLLALFTDRFFNKQAKAFEAEIRSNLKLIRSLGLPWRTQVIYRDPITNSSPPDENLE